MCGDTIQQKKHALRQELHAFRAQLSPPEAATRSRAIVAHLTTFPAVKHAQTIHVYWPRVTTREIDLRPLIHWLQDQNKQIVLPIVQGTSLSHALFDTESSLQPNKWGILEPLHGSRVPLCDIDVVIVPALGADRNGHRIGYGGGYYDRFLQKLRLQCRLQATTDQEKAEVPFICPVYADCLQHSIPVAPFDVPVDIIVTENRILYPAQPPIGTKRTID